MPSEQERVMVERRMNGHWRRRREKKAEVDDRWISPPKRLSRREHSILQRRRIEKENLKLYWKLWRISHSKMTKTREMIASSGDPEVIKKLFDRKANQRVNDRKESQRVLDNQNLKIYNTLDNMKCFIQPVNSMEKEYRERRNLSDISRKNKVSPTALHLIRNYSTSPPKSFSKKSLHQNRSSPDTRFNKFRPKSSGKMPNRFRESVRPRSATITGRQSQHLDNDIDDIYRYFADRAASSVTVEDINSYTSERPDTNDESALYDYACAVNDSTRKFCDKKQTPNFHEEAVAKKLFDTSETNAMDNMNMKGRGSAKDGEPPVHTIDEVQMQEHDRYRYLSATCGSGPYVSRRCLFTETQLQAELRTDDDNDIPSPVFFIKLYDVGEMCDVNQLALSGQPASAVQEPHLSPIGKAAESVLRRNEHSATSESNTRSSKTSRPFLTPTSSGVLIECRLQPETESTVSHELFISMPDVKAMIKRTFAKKSKMWQAFKSIKCRHAERALYECLSDTLDKSLQNQFCGLLAKKINLIVSLDSSSSSSSEKEDIFERINVKFEFQL